MPAYALTIFTGAFLLFQVQPLIGKYILPWFGGGPGVWTTCLLFFQIVLLGGYAYAHVTTRWLKPRAQVTLHLILLAAALALLPIIPAVPTKSLAGGNPTLQILALLAVTLGLPYFVLSSTGPLLQQWFSRTNPGVSPYRLYALSNVGSLLALVSYPFYVETHFTRRTQGLAWGWGLAGYAVCCAFCTLKVWKSNAESQILSPESKLQNQNPASGIQNPESETCNLQPSAWNRLLWLLFPACASALLLATTNKMCQDVAVIPFLWVLPLALYLLSFIICFDSPRWYGRFPFALALVVALTSITWALFQGIDASAQTQVIAYSSGLFICCLVCHGELYALRPDPRHLTGFYLMISAGGALGGLFVAVVAPLIFTDYYELHWSLLLCAVLFLAVCLRDFPLSPALNPNHNPTPVPQCSLLAAPEPRGGGRTPHWNWLACILPLAALAAFDWYAVHSSTQVKQFLGAALAKLAGHHSFPLTQLKWISHHVLSLKGWLIAFQVLGWLLVLGLMAAWAVRSRFLQRFSLRLIGLLGLIAGLAALGSDLWKQARKSAPDRVYTSRNFYGQFTIYEENRDSAQDHLFRLQHGRITHGLQLLDRDERNRPTTYYGEASGVGLAMHALPAGSRRIGLVGLGTGTLAAYGRAGDYLRIYEINPEAKHLATSWFSYVSNCPAKVEIVMGDARLSMQSELSQHFDLLALDAFSGDAIPVHLLTKEAFEIYQRHLKPDGILAVHISNHYLDLEPVVVNLARHFNYQFAAIDHDEGEDDSSWDYSSTWILVSSNEKIINSPAISGATYNVKTNFARVPLWTDDFTSVFQILK